MLIAYYAHHHGRGHLHRAGLLTAALKERTGALVHVLSSSPPAPDLFASGNGTYQRLPLDTGATSESLSEQDATANGCLHWAPVREPGLSARMRQLADFFDDLRPAVLVSDVSVEVTAMARLLGVPVVSFALPGERTDRAHQLGYGLSDAIVAPWPRAAYSPEWLRPFGARVTYTGCFPSRHDPSPTAPGSARGTEPAHGQASSGSERSQACVLLLQGAGGSAIDEVSARRFARRLSGWRVIRAGGGQWVEDLSSAAAQADVVVAHAGLGVVSDLAHWRLPVVLLSEDRPFAEQRTTAAALAANIGCPTVHSLEQVDSALLARAIARPADWTAWSSEGALDRACDVIMKVAKSQ